MRPKNQPMRAVLPLILTLFGCASMEDGKVHYLKAGVTVAPVSVMGDTLALRQVGDRASLNGERFIDVASWRIDRHTESVAGRVLGDAGRFSVASADTAELRKSVRLQDDPWTGAIRIRASSGPLTTFAKQSGADYVLLIGPASVADPFMGTDGQLLGYGIYQRALAGLKHAINYLAMNLIVLDGKSGESVARAQCALSAPRQDSEWLQPRKTVQPGESTRAGIEQLFEGALRRCIDGLKLG
jgi:hypothetical protein